MEKKVSALILCAGESSRMGDFKPLLPLEDSTVIERSVSSVLDVCSHAVVVTGKRAEEVEEVLERAFSGRVSFVRNERYSFTDMLTSIRLGLSVLPFCEYFFLLPGDMPLVRRETFERLIEDRHSADTLYPVFHGRRGHPVLISTRLKEQILAYCGDSGLKGFLSTVDSIKEIPVEDSGILLDLDTRDDYQTAKKLIIRR